MIATLWNRLKHGTMRILCAPDWPRFAGQDWPSKIMQVQATDRFHSKQGRSIARWTLHHDGQALTVYLKRHYRLPRVLGICAALAPLRDWSPGVSEWHHLALAESLGIRVPRAVAAGQGTASWGRMFGFLAVEELTGMLPLHLAIPEAQKRLDPRSFARWKRGLIDELVRIVRLMHDRAIFHNDLYLCHFYVSQADLDQVPDGWRDRVWLIDFHRFSTNRVTPTYARTKDLAQLLYSARIEGITARDRLRFWRGYVGEQKRPWLARYVRWKSAWYERHNRKKSRVI